MSLHTLHIVQGLSHQRERLFGKSDSAIVTEWESYGGAASRKKGTTIFFTVGIGVCGHRNEPGGMRIQKLRSIQHPDNIGVALIVDLASIPGQDAPKQGGAVKYWETHWKELLKLQKAEATRLLDESKEKGLPSKGKTIA